MIRGELYWVDFGVPIGSAAGFRRPAVVLQSDEYNATALNTVIVVPLTSNLNLADYKPNVYITAEESGLSKDSVAIIPLVTALDKMCFIERISSLKNSVVDEICNAVMDMLH
ncbi:MAG: type II toxin-antitoxin system PemK/MazF family toxin [Treponema sp.]|nr:type II toxin-antitoxin system PemK/MazF family toxin [Treponema sp.]